MKTTIISKIAWENRSIEAINYIDVNSIYFQFDEKHTETGIVYSDLPVVTIKCDQKYKICRFELPVDEPKYQPFRRFVLNGLAKELVKTLREDKIDAFRRSLGFNVIDALNSKQEALTKTINKKN